jgi:hypothetical protein
MIPHLRVQIQLSLVPGECTKKIIKEWLVPVAQLVEQLTNGLEFKGLNPAAVGTR